MDWAGRRKIFYLIAALAIALFVVAVPTYLAVHRVPTCADGKQNGDEAGVDCGGSCSLLCSAEVAQPLVKWSRVFPVAGSVYSAVAYIQNANLNSDTVAKYDFKLYDSAGSLLATRTGATYIPKNRIIAIFEPNIDTQGKTPIRAEFEFVGKLNWQRNVAEQPQISVTQKLLSGETSAPRVDATIQNQTTGVVQQIELVAIVYDAQSNAVATSRTFVDQLNGGESANVTFTWPRPFATPSSVVEIIPRIIPKG